MNVPELQIDDLELLRTKDAQFLHKKALEYYDLATIDEFNNDSRGEIRNYIKALKFEEQAALTAQTQDIGEPTISILFRSAASIAIRANKFAKAVELAKLGLSKTTPHEIAKQLEEIIENYKSFTTGIASSNVPGNIQVEFFCVGRDKQIIDYLIGDLDSGYSAENIDFASIMLEKMLVSPNRTLPDVIVCDWQIGASEIERFFHFLESQEKLSVIPFVVNGWGIPAKELDQLRKNHYIDDIIFLEDKKTISLKKRISFLKRMKANIKGYEMAHSNEEKITGRQAVSLKTKTSYIFKRAFDIIVSLILIAILSPLMLIIIITIKVESRGPVFYISKRAGRGYQIFNFYKFRTMVINADSRVKDLAHLNQYNKYDEGAIFFKIINDPRITRFGSFLRNTSLDELPQLFNVLRGDMSLVGNRPLPLYEAATLTTDEMSMRFLSPAGITGLWQIKKRGRADMSIEERINLDIYYAEQNSFVYDLWIIANTPAALIQKSNV